MNNKEANNNSGYILNEILEVILIYWVIYVIWSEIQLELQRSKAVRIKNLLSQRFDHFAPSQPANLQ